jgi:hypothetical protein
MIEFNPGQPAEKCPVVFQIYPEEEWQDVIRASHGLAVGLDEHLEFKVDMDRLTAVLPELTPAEKTKIAHKATGTAKLMVGPFNYCIRRPKIVSKGRGNVKVHWRLEGEEYFEHEESRLAVVLQVPKEVSNIDAVGVLKASKDFRFFTPRLHHLLPHLTEQARNFFKAGAPIVNKMPWQNIIGGH